MNVCMVLRMDVSKNICVINMCMVLRMEVSINICVNVGIDLR